MSEWTGKQIHHACGYNGPAAYKILLYKAERLEIPRLGGIDRTGTLCIGHSQTIDNRRAQFVNALNGKGGHSEGMTFWLANYFKGIDGALLFVYHEVDTKEQAREIEKDELIRYFKEYSELPPLNCKFPQNRVEWYKQLSNVCTA